MNLSSRLNVIYNKLRNYRYDHWLITDDSVILFGNPIVYFNVKKWYLIANKTRGP